MKLMRLGPPGEERPAVLTDDGVLHDLSGLTGDLDGRFFERGGIAEVSAALVERGIFFGADVRHELPGLGAPALVCVTEIHTKADIDRLAVELEAVLR